MLIAAILDSANKSLHVSSRLNSLNKESISLQKYTLHKLDTKVQRYEPKTKA